MSGAARDRPRISVQLLAPIADWLIRRGLPAADLLARVGLSPAVLEDHDRLVALADYIAFFEDAADLAGEPHLGLLLGRFEDVDALGALGHLFMSSPSLLDAFEGLTSHLHALQEASTNRLTVTAAAVQIDYQIDDHRIRRRRQDCEYSVAAIANLARLYSRGAVRPREVWFEHSRAGDYRPYCDHFGCDVFFEQPRNVLFFERAGFNVRGAHHGVLNPIIASHLDSLLRRRSGGETLVAAVRARILQGLAQGRVSETAIASGMGMSTATLVRRLAGEKLSFRALVAQERLAIAERLLVSGERSVAEIAQAAGYAENASFTRAFRRLHGVSPRAFRLAQGGKR